VYSWPDVKNHIFMLALKLYSVLTYWIILCFGVAAMLFYFAKNRVFFVFSAMVIALIVFMGPFLRYTEFRLYFLIFPLMTMLATFVLGELMRKMAELPGLKWISTLLSGKPTGTFQ
jgi:hypothetical protein